MIECNVFCENPRLIFNRQIWRHIYADQGYYANGRHYPVSRNKASEWLYHAPFNIFPPADKLNKEQASQYYCVDEDGVITYAYLYVPCNHCDLCNELVRNEWGQRAIMEAQMYDVEPYFCTLTYNDDNLPSTGVSVREMQLFLKRLRKNYDVPLRYMCSGEYGTKFHRPHYHLIIFANYVYEDLDAAVRRSWNKGFIMSKRLLITNKKPFTYVAKYLKKSADNTPDGKNRSFFLSSRGNGGLGYQKFKEFIPKFRENPACSVTHLQFVERFSGKILRVRINRYFFNKVFPTVARMVDYGFRTAYNTLTVLSRHMEQLDSVRQRWQEWLSNVDFPLCVQPARLSEFQISTYIRNHKNFLVLKSLRDIQRRMFRVPELAYIDYIQRQRERFIAHLPVVANDDLTLTINTIKRQRQQERERDIF